MTLATAKPGSYLIVETNCNRLRELGFIEGTEVLVLPHKRCIIGDCTWGYCKGTGGKIKLKCWD